MAHTRGNEANMAGVDGTRKTVAGDEVERYWMRSKEISRPL